MSSFRRSPTVIHRHLRSISTASSPFITASSISSDNRNPKLLRWISAVVAGTGIGVGVSLYSCSSDSVHGVKSVMSVADWLSSSADKLKEAYDRQPNLSNSNFFIRDALRRRIFFNYEKRLRMLSPPEKVFEYFASVENTKGETLMRPGDLMRAIVPVFPPSESNVVRDGSLRGERSPGELHCAPSEFFMLFDVNNDGLISFEEYIFFVTLLSIPESSFSVAFKMFDIDNDGEIDREEFKKVMNLMRGYNRQGAFKKVGHQTGLKVGSHRENGGVVHYFIGEDGNQRLQLENFVQFLRDLHHEVCGISLSDNVIELNFHLFDANQDGNLCSDEFLRVMHRREREMAQLTKSGIANTTGQTPKMLFRKEHKKLVKSGEEWMKKTVDSYTAITVSINPHFPLC